MVGLYYNKKLLDSAGVKTPIASFEDFLKALDAVKAKGIAPFMIGTAKNHMALHMFASISQANIDAANRKELDDLVYDRGGTWKTKGNLEAAKQMSTGRRTVTSTRGIRASQATTPCSSSSRGKAHS